MFAAAAALTVASAQANAEAKKDAKAKGEEWVCASKNSCGGGAGCPSKQIDAKDPAACKTAGGNWMTKGDFEKKNAKSQEKGADPHKH
jgi:hypothetical protein